MLFFFCFTILYVYANSVFYDLSSVSTLHMGCDAKLVGWRCWLWGCWPKMSWVIILAEAAGRGVDSALYILSHRSGLLLVLFLHNGFLEHQPTWYQWLYASVIPGTACIINKVGLFTTTASKWLLWIRTGAKMCCYSVCSQYLPVSHSHFIHSTDSVFLLPCFFFSAVHLYSFSLFNFLLTFVFIFLFDFRTFLAVATRCQTHDGDPIYLRLWCHLPCCLANEVTHN